LAGKHHFSSQFSFAFSVFYEIPKPGLFMVFLLFMAFQGRTGPFKVELADFSCYLPFIRTYSYSLVESIHRLSKFSAEGRSIPFSMACAEEILDE